MGRRPNSAISNAENNDMMNFGATESNNATSSILDKIASEIDEVGGGAIDDKYVTDLPLDKPIRVKSMTYGELIYKSPKTNSLIKWSNLGAVITMRLEDIIEMNNYSTEYLRKPYVILLDEDAINYFKLNDIYENLAGITNLPELFTKDIDTISKAIDKALSVNLDDILKSKVQSMYANGTLTDINIIKLLENKLKFDLTNE